MQQKGSIESLETHSRAMPGDQTALRVWSDPESNMQSDKPTRWSCSIQVPHRGMGELYRVETESTED